MKKIYGLQWNIIMGGKGGHVVLGLLVLVYKGKEISIIHL